MRLPLSELKRTAITQDDPIAPPSVAYLKGRHCLPRTQLENRVGQRPTLHNSAGCAGTGAGRALVVAGRSVAIITDRAVGLETIGRAPRARPSAGLCHVTGPRRWATDRGAGLQGVGGTVGTRPRAGLRHVTGPRGWP